MDPTAPAKVSPFDLTNALDVSPFDLTNAEMAHCEYEGRGDPERFQRALSHRVAQKHGAYNAERRQRGQPEMTLDEFYTRMRDRQEARETADRETLKETADRETLKEVD